MSPELAVPYEMRDRDLRGVGVGSDDETGRALLEDLKGEFERRGYHATSDEQTAFLKDTLGLTQEELQVVFPNLTTNPLALFEAFLGTAYINSGVLHISSAQVRDLARAPLEALGGNNALEFIAAGRLHEYLGISARVFGDTDYQG